MYILPILCIRLFYTLLQIDFPGIQNTCDLLFIIAEFEDHNQPEF